MDELPLVVKMIFLLVFFCWVPLVRDRSVGINLARDTTGFEAGSRLGHCTRIVHIFTKLSPKIPKIS
jgi:hypothetical protein